MLPNLEPTVSEYDMVVRLR